jgi:hypothetical protein
MPMTPHVPEGRLTADGSSVPPGRGLDLAPFPTDESVGYCQLSFQDENRSFHAYADHRIIFLKFINPRL